MRSKLFRLVLILATVFVLAAGLWSKRESFGQRLLAFYVTQQTSQPSSIPHVPPSGITFPFELVNQHVMLEVSVNGSRPLWFILDTGDRWAVLDRQRAKEMGLQLAGEIPVAGVGPKSSTAAFVKDAAFSISGLAGFSQPVNLAIPLRNLAPFLGHDCDGIIGTEFIKNFVVELDYEARVIRLHDKNSFAYAGPGEIIPIRLDSQGQPIIRAEVTPVGSAPIQGEFKLDIGSGGSLALYSPFVAEHHLPGPNVNTIRRNGGGGTGGATAGQYGRLAMLRIGKFNLGNPLTFFSEDKAGNFSRSAIQGNIGAQVFRKFRVFLDYSHDRVILEPNATFAEPLDRASSGLNVEAEGTDYKTFRIKDVLENSPAAEAGLRKDDVITAIDGRAASDLTFSKLLEMFERPASYKLTVGRGEQTLTVTLKPRKLV
ncbi:MAG TPA: aspartyl protease family protein [Terriglobales bacterium]|jgi:hypothetical protein